MQTNEDLVFPGVKHHHAHRENLDNLADLPLYQSDVSTTSNSNKSIETESMTSNMNTNSLCSPPSPQNVFLKHSMSDDETTIIRSKTKHRSYSLSQSSIDNEAFNNNHNNNINNNNNDALDANVQISPLLLDHHKRNSNKNRSKSMALSRKSIGYNKYANLKKKYKDQQSQHSSQIQVYQEKITDIQDDAEENEEAMQREYEFKIHHLETQYIAEKAENKSLKDEMEKLKRELYIHKRERQISIGYSTAATAQSVANQYEQPSMQRYYSGNSVRSNNTVVINATDTSSNASTNTNASMDAIVLHKSHKKIKKRANSNSSVSSNSSSSSSASSSSSSSSSTYSSDSTYDSSDNDAQNINTQRRKNKYKNSKYPKRNQQIKAKRKKIPKQLSKKNEQKGFWWSLFGPPNLMCSTCSSQR